MLKILLTILLVFSIFPSPLLANHGREGDIIDPEEIRRHDGSQFMGGFCQSNSECETGKCESNTCVCNDNSDCGEGKCRKPLFKPNWCDHGEATRTPMGGACWANKQCDTGKCEGNVCVCKKNSDCASGKCKKPIFKRNFCE